MARVAPCYAADGSGQAAAPVFGWHGGNSGSIRGATMSNKRRTYKRVISAQPFDAADAQTDDRKFLYDERVEGGGLGARAADGELA
jgi:hypothetical protein